MSASKDKPTIIIKKKGKKAKHAHHGGSWKIAYADFVTAMMAFFMLMWLVNVTTDEQKKGIADYFTPNFVNMQSRNGSAGMMGGINVTGENNSDGKSGEQAHYEKVLTEEIESEAEVEPDEKKTASPPQL